jgi:LmbE family N-acetylglucosaminyl deacetylase
MRVSVSIQNYTQLESGQHKLVRTPDTQPRQHPTHISVFKVVLRAMASARCCAPAAPILLP